MVCGVNYLLNVKASPRISVQAGGALVYRIRGRYDDRRKHLNGLASNVETVRMQPDVPWKCEKAARKCE